MLYVAIVSGLTVKSLINFDLIFVYGKRSPIRFLIPSLHETGYHLGFPSDSVVKESAWNSGDVEKTRIQFLDWEDPLGKEMTTHPSILRLGNPTGRESGGLQATGRRVGHDLLTKQQRIYPNNGLVCSPGGAGRAGCLYIFKIVSKMETQKHITFCVENKRKNLKYICMFMYKRAWKHSLKTYNGLLLAEES